MAAVPKQQADGSDQKYKSTYNATCDRALANSSAARARAVIGNTSCCSACGTAPVDTFLSVQVQYYAKNVQHYCAIVKHCSPTAHEQIGGSVGQVMQLLKM